MSYLRLRMDLAVKRPLPQALHNKLPLIQDYIRQLKAFASKINEGQENEENTTTATYHVCHNDTQEPCEPEEDI